MSDTIAATAPTFARAVQSKVPALPHMATPLDQTSNHDSLENSSAQVVDSFDAPVGSRHPGDYDCYSNPDRQFHKQTNWSRSVPRWSHQDAGRQNDEQAHHEPGPIQLDTEFRLRLGENSQSDEGEAPPLRDPGANTTVPWH